MESGGGSTGKAKKVERHRRPWTDTEERVLMDKLKELVRNGWKSDNGFKPGYQQKLEEMMIQELPYTDIRATPHINSKITMWKRSYGSIRTMLTGSSGIGFNTTTHLLDCNNEQWMKAVKNDPLATNMRYKTWGMYDDWIEVFGHDRANGMTSENVFDAFTNLENESGQSQQPNKSTGGSNTTAYEPELNMETDEVEMVGDSQPAERDPTTEILGKHKRSTSSVVDPLVEVLDKLVTTSDARLGNLCRVIGYEAELGKARKNVFNLVCDIPKLNLDQKIDICKILAKDSNLMEMFSGFDEEARAHYALRLLED